MRIREINDWNNITGPLLAVSLVALVASGCTKREFNLSQDTTITGTLDPAFAVPLVQGGWSFGEVIGSIEVPANIETEATGEITAIFPFDAFETAPIPLMPLSEFVETTFALGSKQAAAFSLLPAGAELNVDFSHTLEVPMPHLTEVDSVWLGNGTLGIQMQSPLALDITVLGTCSGILRHGQPLTVELSLDEASGTSEITIPMTNTTLIGTAAEGVSLNWELSVTLAATGQPIDAGEALTLRTAFEEVAVVGAFGKFSSELSQDIEARMALPEITRWDPALFYLSAPRLVLEVNNSYGIDLGLDVTELSLVSDEGAIPLQGPAIDAFPDITGALAVGDTAWTTHALDNAGMDPDWSDLINAAPDSLKLFGSVKVLPPSVGGQFATATDVLSCTGAFEVPLAGWARGVTWRDTLSTPISQELQAGVAPPLDWTDVTSVTLRFIIDNGWPLELNGMVHFINAQGDSLLAGPGLSIPGGSDVPATAIVDYTLDRPLAMELMEMECAAIATTWTLATTGASVGQSVELHANDYMSMQIAAKVECQIDPTP